MSDAGPAATPLTVTVLAIAFALAGPLVALAPRGMWILTIVAGVAAFAVERIRSSAWPLPSRRALLLCGLFVGWCALTLIWDIEPRDGASKLLALAAIVTSALALLGVAGRLDDAQRGTIGRVLVGGTIVGVILLGIETIFDFPFYRAVIGPDPKLTGLLESKRSVDALPLLVWPAALALERLGRRWLGVALAVAWTLASFRLTASSATGAMILSLAVLALATWSAPLTRRILTVGSVLAFVLIVPLTIAVYDQGIVNNEALKVSARHRIEIWHFAALKTLNRPLFGHGLDSSRFVPNGDEVSQFQPDKTKPIIPLHPHNAFLQIWLELGLVGAAIAGTILVSMTGAIKTWPSGSARFAMATYTAALIVAGLAFGIWQTWWMATLAIGMAACAAVAPRRVTAIESVAAVGTPRSAHG